MTMQPPNLPVEGVFEQPDSPPSADSGDQPEGLVIQDTPVIDATKLPDSRSDEN